MSKLIKKILKEELSDRQKLGMKKAFSVLHKKFKLSGVGDISVIYDNIYEFAKNNIPYKETGKLLAYLEKNFQEDGNYQDIDIIEVDESDKKTFNLYVPEVYETIEYRTTTYEIDAWSKEEAISLFTDDEENAERIDYNTDDYGDSQWVDTDYDNIEVRED